MRHVDTIDICSGALLHAHTYMSSGISSSPQLVVDGGFGYDALISSSLVGTSSEGERRCHWVDSEESRWRWVVLVVFLHPCDFLFSTLQQLHLLLSTCPYAPVWYQSYISFLFKVTQAIRVVCTIVHAWLNNINLWFLQTANQGGKWYLFEVLPSTLFSLSLF